ncbi:MAG: 4a-hydroxytetrahydrobiopterin dehydratase [bacterium]
MTSPVFISYRRDDAGPDAIALSSAVRGLLGDEAVFMDTKSLSGGDSWPDVLKRAVLDAETVIVVIGPDWVRVSDQWGQRRIDQKDDWVRQELIAALEDAGKRVIPVLVRGAELPPSTALPEQIRPLLNRQVIEIRRDYWNHDVQLLLAQLRATTAANEVEDLDPSPYPHDHPEGPEHISMDRLQRILDTELTRWRLVESTVPETPSTMRMELFRELKFKTFQGAIGFMAQMAPGCDIAMHHPRWENIWKTVRVYFTTWDIGHRISDRDVQLARYFDRAYSEFDARAQTIDKPDMGANETAAAHS